MSRVPLKGAAYTARSITANAQRCVNLYPEQNPEGAPVEFTHYPTPGLRTLASPTVAVGRGLFKASNNQLYAVVGASFYVVSSAWVFTKLGSMVPNVSTPVSMTDNGTTLLCVDGTSTGYTVQLLTNTFGTLTSASFYGGDRVAFLDTFFVLNKPGTGIFYSSLANSTSFDPTYYATKIGFSDLLSTVAVLHREIWLIGQTTCEIWVNSGAAAFPFQILTGAFVQHGCVAKYSVATMGDAIFWVSQDLEGQSVILQGGGYDAQRISTHAVEDALRGYPTLADAVGFCYQQDGHQFYMLSFPSADRTWCYDLTTKLWHERVWLDSNGIEHRHRALCHAFAYGTNVVLDWQTGKLYAMDLNTYTDNGAPIVRRRGFPHMINDGKRVIYTQFIADMESGTALVVQGRRPASFAGAYTPTPEVWLRWSDDKGATWGNPIFNSLGATGNSLNSVQYQRMGMARDRVFELFWSSPVKTALNGAFVETKASKS